MQETLGMDGEGLLGELLREDGGRQAVAKVNYSHDKVIDLMVANPRVTQRELAAFFGYNEGWFSRLVNSDAFRLRLAQRRADLVDPLIGAALEVRFKALATRGLEVLQEKLDQPASLIGFREAAQAVELGAKGLAVGGFGQKVNVDVTAHIDLRAAVEQAEARRQKLMGEVLEGELVGAVVEAAA